MRKLNSVLVALMLAMTISPAKADPPVDTGNQNAIKPPNSKFFFSEICYGQTDYPHLSSHVPGTVNVTARTGCTSGTAYVKTTLTRKGPPSTKHVMKQKQGKGHVTISVSMKCTWLMGDPEITYVAESLHVAASGARTYTKTTKDLKC